MKKRYRRIVHLEVIFEAKSDADAVDVFEDIDLGTLDIEERAGLISTWNHQDSDALEIDVGGVWNVV